MSAAQTYRVELERLDHGYEARVPEMHGCLSVGLTEGETLRRILDILGSHAVRALSPEPVPEGPFRLEVFRT